MEGSEELANLLEETRLRPSDADAFSKLGLCYLQLKEPFEASAAFERSIYLSPKTAAYRHYSGLALQLAGRYSEAMNAFRQAISLDPKATDSFSALATLQHFGGDKRSAGENYKSAWKASPDSCAGLLALAKSLLIEGNLIRAEEIALLTVQADPASAEAYVTLGNIQQQLGKFEEAIFAFEGALRLDPERLNLYFQIVSSKKITCSDLALVERISEAAKGEALIPRVHRSLLYALGKAYDDLGEFGKAMAAFDQANQVALRIQRDLGVTFDRRALAAEVDQTLAAFSKERLRDFAITGSGSDKPIFVVGMIRSGSTLVEQILSSHPSVGAAGELRFWPEAAARLFGRQRGQTAIPTHGEVGNAYLKLLENVAPGKSRVVDKMPANYALLGLIHLVFPRAKMIVTTREAIDNCLSIYMTNFRDEYPPFAHDRDNIVFNYKQYERLMEHWKTVLPPDVLLEVAYEHLVKDPESVTRRMLEFCGLEWDDACLAHEKNDRPIQTPSLWQVRQPIYTSSLARWRNYGPWLGSLSQLQ